MAKTTIIIDGAGVTATLGTGGVISDINTISFGVFGERSEIDLTTIDATKFKTKLLGDLQKIQDIVINKKSSPAEDVALYNTDSESLAIAYKIGKSTNKVITFYVQLKSISPSNVERAPGNGVNVDLTFFVTNIDAKATMVETAPAITTPA